MSLLSTIAAVAPKIMQKIPKFAGQFAKMKDFNAKIFNKLGIPEAEHEAVGKMIGEGIQNLRAGGQQQAAPMPSVDMPQMSQIDLSGTEIPGTMMPGQMGAMSNKPRRRTNLYGGMG